MFYRESEGEELPAVAIINAPFVFVFVPRMGGSPKNEGVIGLCHVLLVLIINNVLYFN